MKADKNIQSALYRHLVLEGTSYDVGKKLGKYIKAETDPIREFTLKPSTLEKTEKAHIQKCIDLFQKYCPGINDEIKGLAEGLGVEVEQLLYYISSYRSKGCCSQMVVLPKITNGGGIYLARNYEYRPQESDLCLITTKVKGKASHIGFSELGLGRNDGINEHGLCISMPNAAPGITSNSIGFEFWFIIRAVLDLCTNVNEAIDLIKNVPTSTYSNFIIVDKNANSALIEVAGSKKSVVRINTSHSKQYLCAANHFSSKQMLSYGKARYWDSVARYIAMELRINDAIPCVDKNTLKDIQSDFIPLGICCHNYSSGFGTLWSVIYDPIGVNMEVCFGSPKINEWHTFNLKNSLNETKYWVILPNDNKKPLWKKLPSGSNICLDFEIV
ncbi:C45 family autoproteolytic acyltransferase/hydolase [Desnuesiella massiliensis]|uniref:C45 family autoproteolytic acyltransferase/hydolase n=1 Tax=Desnuesiella massiliensis TaxID=1650662 RepID=UPI0006E44AA8|nr:C45 family peptidase [Desnuesiella massiliensis]